MAAVAAMVAGLLILSGAPSAQAQPIDASLETAAAGTSVFVPLAAPVPGSSIDLQVVLSGPASSAGGAPFSYTLQLANNSLPDADGSTFSFATPAGSTNVSASCSSATNGAACATFTSTTNSTVEGTLPTLPHLGTVLVTIAGNYPIGVASVTGTAGVAPPTGTTDPDPSTNTSFVSTALSRQVDTTVTKSVDLASIEPGDTATYTLTYSNAGPSGADGASIYDALNTSSAGSEFAGMHVRFSGCTSTGGAVCPALNDNDSSGTSSVILQTSLPTFPGNSSVTITYQVTFDQGVGCTSSDDPSVYNYARIDSPANTIDTNYSNQTFNLFTPAEVTDCPRVDTTVTKSVDLASIEPGDTATYTLTYSNNGAGSADGASIYDALNTSSAGSEFAGMHVRFSGCTSTGGAVCPALNDNDSSGTSSVILQTSLPTFPGNSSVTITYQVTFDQGVGCTSSDDPSVYNYARIDSPANTIDTNYSNQTFNLFTPAEVTDCPRVDTTVTKSVDLASIEPGDTATYTLTYSNNGAGSADGASIYDALNLGNSGTAFGGNHVRFIDCTTTGGAVCPTLTDSTNTGTSSVILQTSLPTFPGNSSVTITYQVTFDQASVGACSSSSNASAYNYARIDSPANTIDINYSNQAFNLFTPVNCAEVTVNMSVTPASVHAGQAVSYLVNVTNAGTASANNINFSDTLPANFNYSSVSCAQLAGTPICPPVSYDAAAHSLSAIIGVLASGDGVTFTITGTAGVTSGTYANTAFATPSATNSYFDPNPSTNSSQVNLQIFNTTSPITVTKQISGLSAAGLPADQTFTGTITCAAQGSTPWSVIVSAGQSSASAAPIQLFDGDACSIQETTPTTAPAGYTWVGTPIVTPSVIQELGPTTPVAVTVTNTLEATPATTAAIVITKQVTGLPSTGLPAPTTIDGQIICTDPDGGDDVVQNWTLTIPAGQVSASTPLIDEPVGVSCRITETAPSTAPSGYSWSGDPIISPASTGTLTAGQTVPVTVTNTLAADPASPTGSLALTKKITGATASGVSGTFGFTAFCGDGGIYTTAIQVIDGTTGSATIANVPAEAVCSIQESSVTTAPDGFTWKTPEISARTVAVATDTAAPVTITNPLQAKASPASPASRSSDGGIEDLASTGLVLGSTASVAALLLGFGIALVVSRRRKKEA